MAAAPAPSLEQHVDALTRHLAQLSPNARPPAPPALRLAHFSPPDLAAVLADLYYALGRRMRWASVSVLLEFPWYLDGLETPPERARFRADLVAMPWHEFNTLTETALALVPDTFLLGDSSATRSPALTEGVFDNDDDGGGGDDEFAVSDIDYPLFPDMGTRVREERTKFFGDLTETMDSRLDASRYTSFNGALYCGTYCGTKVAVKVLPETGTLAHTRILSEHTRSWPALKHPNLLPYLGHWAAEGHLGVVRPWASLDVMSRLGLDTSLDPLTILVSVAEALAYLHGAAPRAVVHGNVNPCNVLITDNGTIVLADWGVNSVLDRLSVLSELNSNLSADDCRNMAPELFDRLASRTTKSDVFAFAVLCTQLYSRQRPFAHLQYSHEVSAAISRGERPYVPTTCEPGLRALLSDCWEAQPELRPGMQEVLVRLRRELARRAAKSACDNVTPPSSPRLNTLGLDGVCIL